MARVIFSLTDAQAAALTEIRNGNPPVCDVRVMASLFKRGFVSGNADKPTLSPLGFATASLVELLAMPTRTPAHGS